MGICGVLGTSYCSRRRIVHARSIVKAAPSSHMANGDTTTR